MKAIELKIQKALSFDLLSNKQKKMLNKNDHFTTGHCYIAAEAAYHFLGGKNKGWKPMCISMPEINNTHWFIKNKSGDICDPTKEQFDGNPPYNRAKGSGFLTISPSKRAMIILKRIGFN